MVGQAVVLAVGVEKCSPLEYSYFVGAWLKMGDMKSSSWRGADHRELAAGLNSVRLEVECFVVVVVAYYYHLVVIVTLYSVPGVIPYY